MTAVHAAFSCRYEYRTGAKNVSVLAERHDSIRPDIVVDLPVRQDWHRGSFHETTGLYEKVWIDPVYAIREIYDIDYSSGLASCLAVRFDVEQSYMGGSETWLTAYRAEFANGKAVCLWQSFDVVQDYLGGTETWAGSHGQDFALGRAVCLWQSFEVVQDYLGGTEAWASSHEQYFAIGRAVCLWQQFEVIQGYLGGSETWTSSHGQDFALGRAVCLCHEFQVIQDYIGGSEAWTSSYGQDFALGRAVCLNQIYQIDQPYVGGNEHWPSLYGSYFASGEAVALIQCCDIIQPYQGGREDWIFRFDNNVPSVTGQMFLVGTENTEIAALGVSVGCMYEIKTMATGGTAFAFDSVNAERYFGTVFSHDRRFNYHYLANAETDTVLIDTLGGGPRTVDVVSTFEVPETSSLELLGRYDFTEYASAGTFYAFDRQNAGSFLLCLQEEAYYEYVACLTNVHTGLVTIVTTPQRDESLSSLAEHCKGDAEWQVEYETRVRFYNPDWPDRSRDPVLWRFLTAGGKHWKPGPVVSDLRATRLPSFTEVHFTADWPYRAFEQQIGAYQFQATEEGDWFDLAVWISDSLRFDMNENPVLTIPYASDTTNYDVHVPHRETTRYIAVAPIRKFPYEEIGALSVIHIP